ncbi:MAG: nucleotide sugar dehydrogenase, partial [Actinobacteria bacterium]|nr:nucleotide sugar dehydrogenase [Actinomycetota bacterium]
IIICVPTPLGEHREPDLSYIIGTAKTISKYIQTGQLIILKSTTYPGTTDEVVLPILEKSGLKAGADFNLAYSPEREDPGNKEFTTFTIPILVGGITPRCQDLTCSMYNKIGMKTVPVSNTKVAESAKLLENIYRAVNIALVNELKVIFDKMNIDIFEVIDAARTKPFGFQAFYPGPGLGGHCIPIDPFYLSWKAREYDYSTRFIELAGEINALMPEYVINRTIEALGEQGKALKNSKVLILGMSYKKNIDDMREAPSLKLMDILIKKGARVDYSDPFIQTLPETRQYKFSKESIELTGDNIKSYDCIIISTDHDDFDREKLKNNANLIIDTRNMFKISGIKKGKIYKA